MDLLDNEGSVAAEGEQVEDDGNQRLLEVVTAVQPHQGGRRDVLNLKTKRVNS